MEVEAVLFYSLFALTVSLLLEEMVTEYRKTRSLKNVFETYFFMSLALVFIVLAVATQLIFWLLPSIICFQINKDLRCREK